MAEVAKTPRTCGKLSFVFGVKGEPPSANVGHQRISRPSCLPQKNRARFYLLANIRGKNTPPAKNRQGFCQYGGIFRRFSLHLSGNSDKIERMGVFVEMTKEEIKEALDKEIQDLKKKYNKKLDQIKAKERRAATVEAEKRRKRENHAKYLLAGFILAEMNKNNADCKRIAEKCLSSLKEERDIADFKLLLEKPEPQKLEKPKKEQKETIQGNTSPEPPVAG